MCELEAIKLSWVAHGVVSGWVGLVSGGEGGAQRTISLVLGAIFDSLASDRACGEGGGTAGLLRALV